MSSISLPGVTCSEASLTATPTRQWSAGSGPVALGVAETHTTQVATAECRHIPWDRYGLVGIPEVAATLGTVVGFAVRALGAAAGIGLALLMLGAVVMRIRVHDSAVFVRATPCFSPRPSPQGHCA